MSSWMLAECDTSAEMDELYERTISRRWGMTEPDGKSLATIQGVDYVNTEKPSDYGDAWMVANSKIVGKDTLDPKTTHNWDRTHF